MTFRDLFLISILLYMISGDPTVHMAPVLSSGNPTMDDNSILVVHTVRPDSTSGTRAVQFPAEQKSAHSSPLQSAGSYERYQLEQLTPVDLYDPCKMEDESWSEGYFHSTHHKEEPNDSDIGEWPDENGNNNAHMGEHNQTEGQDQVNAMHPQMTERGKLGYSILHEMIHKSNHLQGLVTDMIRNHLIKECRHLELPGVMEIPKHNSTGADNLVQSLSGIYRILANQTAHHYFKWTVQRKQLNDINGCSQHGQPTRDGFGSARTLPMPTEASSKPPLATLLHKRAHARKVADDFQVVSTSLRALMCNFKQAFHLFSLPVPTDNIVQQVLSHSFMGSVICARMSFVDCQLMKNSVNIFAHIEEFLRKSNTQFFAHAKSHVKKP